MTASVLCFLWLFEFHYGHDWLTNVYLYENISILIQNRSEKQHWQKGFYTEIIFFNKKLILNHLIESKKTAEHKQHLNL